MNDEFIEVYYRRIPCYFNPETFELYGRNWFWDLCVEVMLWFDNSDEIEIYEEEEIEFIFEEDDEEEKDSH